jgi:hypothetical protein
MTGIGGLKKRAGYVTSAGTVWTTEIIYQTVTQTVQTTSTYSPAVTVTPTSLSVVHEADPTSVVVFTSTFGVCATSVVTQLETLQVTVSQTALATTTRTILSTLTNVATSVIESVSVQTVTETDKTTVIQQSTVTVFSTISPSISFTKLPSQNAAVASYIQVADLNQATRVASASVTTILAMQSISVPITSTLGPSQVSPVAFKTELDSTGPPIVAVQLRSVVVKQVGTPFSWTLIKDGLAQGFASRVQFSNDLVVTLQQAQLFMILTPNIGLNKPVAMLLPSEMSARFTVETVVRIFHEKAGRKRAVELQFADTRQSGQFAINRSLPTYATRQTTIKTTTTTRSTSKRATSTAVMRHAQFCQAGKKYSNSLNCCCAPPVTRTIGKRALTTLNSAAVRPLHLCGVCRTSLGGPACCPPKRHTVYKTVTRSV